MPLFLLNHHSQWCPDIHPHNYDYNFALVHDFPEDFIGVRILNNPLVQLEPQTPVVEVSAAAVNELSGKGNEINDCNTIEASETGYKCNICERKFEELNSLKFHKLRMHKTGNRSKRDKSESCGAKLKNVRQHKLTKHKNTLCDFPGCVFTSQSQSGIKMHKQQCHSKNQSACIADTELLNLNRRRHIRPSTVLHTAPAINYKLVDPGKTTSQITFFDLPNDKRHQLYRAYYELVMYVPWQNVPDETFLDADVRAVLENRDQHSEIDARQSLQRLEEFFKVYKKLYDAGKVAAPGSRWHADNRFSYSMYLVCQHNRDIHLDRVDNKGVFKAKFDEADELENVNVDIRAAVNDVSDLSDYPSFETFMPPQDFRDIVEQKPMQLSEICVAFPLQHQWQRLKELATHDRKKRFIATPPPSQVDYTDMTPIQQFAVDLGIDEKHQILFMCGKAGSGKTAVALKICEHFAGRVQATSFTGKSAALFDGPTIHSMFGWSHNEHKLC